MSKNQDAQAGGIWDVRRRIRVPALGHEADAAALVRVMESFNGVKEVVADAGRNRIDIRYDASVVDYQSLMAVLEEQGYPPAKNWWTSLKGNWYQFTDSNSRENANLPPPACCNKAPKKR
jgi:hypothetical protein